MVFDPLTVLFDLLFLGVGVAALLVSIDPLPDFSSASAEYYTLVIWCTLGSMLVAPAADLFTLFLCLQLTSLPLVVLIGYCEERPALRRGRSRSTSWSQLVATTLLSVRASRWSTARFGRNSFTAWISAQHREPPRPASRHRRVRAHAHRHQLRDVITKFHCRTPEISEGGGTPVTALVSSASRLTGFVLVLRFVVAAFGADPDLRGRLRRSRCPFDDARRSQHAPADDVERPACLLGIAQAGYIVVGLAAVQSDQHGHHALLP